MRVAVQPCGDAVAREHYVDTVQNLVPASRIKPHLTPDQVAAFDSCFGATAAVWGVTPGVRGGNRRKWEKLHAGDIALLYRNRRLFSQGRIALTLHSPKLARELWSVTEDGVTWEHVYFLDELQEIDIPVTRFNKALDYEPTNIVQGFNVYEGTKADALLALLEVTEVEPEIDVSPADSSVLQLRLSELPDLDVPLVSTARKEAGIFREHLFGQKKSCECQVCGRVLPANLLVAAHIKPRASCSDAERRNLKIVMSACKLGCDELFEKSYIYVVAGGAIVLNDNLTSLTPDLRAFASQLSGKMCRAFDSSTAGYFKWHQEHPRRYLRKLA